MKVCAKCDIEKSFELFNKNKQRKDGLQSFCIDCEHKIRTKWRAENPEKVREAHAKWRAKNQEALVKWRAENPEKIREAHAKWRAKNLEKVREAHAKWRAENPDKDRKAKAKWRVENPEKQREASAKWRCKNRDKAREIIAKWRAENRGKCNAITAKRRALKLQATPPWAELDLIKIVYEKAKEWDAHVDHIVPLNSDIVCGLHVWHNLQILPKEVNRLKSNTDWPDKPT